jgi:ankyrin repeat protein
MALSKPDAGGFYGGDPPMPAWMWRALKSSSNWMVMAVLAAMMVIAPLMCMSTTMVGIQRKQMGPLQLAATAGDVPKLEQLLNQGYPIDGRCALLGWTALHAATDAAQVDAARVLIAHGAKLDLHDERGYTPLHIAGNSSLGKGSQKSTEAARNAIARLLIDHGADVNARTLHQDTPLHCAVLSRDAELVRMLMAAGADPSLKNVQGCTPSDLNRSYKDAAVEAALGRSSSSTKPTG